MDEHVVHLVPERLIDQAEVFGRAGRRVEEFTQQLVGRMNAHNPASGDDTGEAIGEQYFEKAQALLNTGALAGALMTDMADLVVQVARYGGRVERGLMLEIEDDLESYDPKMIDSVGSPPDPTGASPHGAGRH